jgi:UDP-N-acetylmuramate dehydrogenase
MQIEENISLSKYCTWHVGGPARYFVKVSEIEELQEALSWAENNKLKFFILGMGSNTLFSDEGFLGLVIKLDCRRVTIKGNELCAEAGAIMRVAVLQAAKEGLGGIEHLAGIPGTIGGMVRGNAGSLGTETKDYLLRVKVLHKTEGGWQIETIDKKDIFFAYRDSIFKREKNNYIIWEASFKLNNSNEAEIVKLVNEDLKTRKERQPYDFPSAGSVFKNPTPKRSAGNVIEESGCKGMNVGGAWVSEKHANFIMNKGGATSADIQMLIQRVKKQVLEKTGVSLEEEIVLV